MDFPSTGLTPGTIVTFPNGQAYRWNGGQWDLIGTNLPTNTARNRNRINNPTAQVSQENGGTAMTTNGAVPADQWHFGFSGIVCVAQRVSAGVLSPEGTTTAVQMYASTAKPSLAAGDYMILNLPIEGLDVADLGWGTANAKQAVLRFCAGAATPGTYGFSVTNTDSSRCWCGSFTLAQANVAQVFSFAVPGDTTGTWAINTNAGVIIRLGHAFGSTFVGVAGWQGSNKIGPSGCLNGAAVLNAALWITDVGLYSDPDNTGIAPPFVAPPYEDDLARCQRYWNRITAWMKSGYYNGTAASYGTAIFPSVMRVTPAITYSSQNYSNASAFVANNSSPDSVTNGVTVTVAGAFWAQANITCNARLI